MSAMQIEELLALERPGWDSLCSSSGADFFGKLKARDAVTILSHGFILGREAVRAALRDAVPWDCYAISEPRPIALGDDTATLIYRARAQRGQKPPFTALMSSTYRSVNGRVCLVIYQQTPVSHDA